MNPNMDQNPFAAILSQLGGGSAPQQGMRDAGAMIATQPVSKPQGMPKVGPDGKPFPDPLQRGQNPGTSKFVISAMQAMQGALAEATDPEEVSMLRQILQMLVQVVDKDQARMSQGMGNSAPEALVGNPAQAMMK